MSKSNVDIEIDFNNLFNLNLTYSFDVLKGVLEAFVLNQKTSNTKISNLEQQIQNILQDNKNSLENFKQKEHVLETDNDESMLEDENKSKKEKQVKTKTKQVVKRDEIYNTEENDNNNNNIVNNNIIVKNKLSVNNFKNDGVGLEYEKNINIDDTIKDDIKNEDKNDTKKDDIKDYNTTNNLLQNNKVMAKDVSKESLINNEEVENTHNIVSDITNDGNFKQLLRRVNKLEGNRENVKDSLQIIINDINSLKIKSKKNSDQIETNYFNNEKNFENIDNNHSNVERRVDTIENKIEEMNKAIENLKAEMMDTNLNFLDNKKDIPEMTPGGTISVDVIQQIINNLERKTLKKFEYIDEKHKRSEEDITKLKNEMNKINGLLDGLNGNLNSYKEKIDLNEKAIHENKTNNQISLDQFNKSLKDKTDNLQTVIDNEVKFLKEKIKTMYDQKELDQNNKNKHDQVDPKVIKEINQKILDLENKMKSYIG